VRYFPSFVLLSAVVLGQTNNPDTPTFQSKVNLVLVPVVVRDSHGRAIGNLTKDDFQLFDKGKPQTIISFSMVKRARYGDRGHDYATV
jgi:hypothetical protein